MRPGIPPSNAPKPIDATTSKRFVVIEVGEFGGGDGPLRAGHSRSGGHGCRVFARPCPCRRISLDARVRSHRLHELFPEGLPSRRAVTPSALSVACRSRPGLAAKPKRAPADHVRRERICPTASAPSSRREHRDSDSVIGNAGSGGIDPTPRLHPSGAEPRVGSRPQRRNSALGPARIRARSTSSVTSSSRSARLRA